MESEPRIFRYFAPSSEEQKSFGLLFLGSLLAIGLIGGLYMAGWALGRGPILLGAGAAIVYRLGRAAWQLENKGQRARHGFIELSAAGLTFCDAAGRKQEVAWPAINHSDVSGGRLLLAKAVDEAQPAAIGNQAGGRVGFFMETDDFATDHAAFVAKGVVFREPPRHEAYGTVAVFEDPFGNLWDLIEPKG